MCLPVAVAHGQIAGFTFNGFTDPLCVGGSDSTSDPDGYPTSLASSSQGSAFSCPLCTSVTLSLGLLFSLAWPLPQTSRLFAPTPTERRPFPHYI